MGGGRTLVDTRPDRLGSAELMWKNVEGEEICRASGTTLHWSFMSALSNLCTAWQSGHGGETYCCSGVAESVAHATTECNSLAQASVYNASVLRPH